MSTIFKDLNDKDIENDIVNYKSIEVSLKNILTTFIGTISGFPEFSTDANLLFEPNDIISINAYVTSVRASIARFETRIDVISLDAYKDSINPNKVNVTLKYRIKATSEIVTVRI